MTSHDPGASKNRELYSVPTYIPTFIIQLFSTPFLFFDRVLDLLYFTFDLHAPFRD